MVLAPLLFMQVLLTSCQDIKKPELLGIDAFRIGRMGRVESSVSFDLECFNPNRSGFVLKAAKGEAWLDSIFVGHFTVDSLVRIPAKGKFSVPVNLKVDMEYLLKHPISSLLRSEKWVRLEGKARVGRGIIFINYPIRYQGMQDLGKLVK